MDFKRYRCNSTSLLNFISEILKYSYLFETFKKQEYSQENKFYLFLKAYFLLHLVVNSTVYGLVFLF